MNLFARVGATVRWSQAWQEVVLREQRGQPERVSLALEPEASQVRRGQEWSALERALLLAWLAQRVSVRAREWWKEPVWLARVSPELA